MSDDRLASGMTTFNDYRGVARSGENVDGYDDIGSDNLYVCEVNNVVGYGFFVTIVDRARQTDITGLVHQSNIPDGVEHKDLISVGDDAVIHPFRVDPEIKEIGCQLVAVDTNDSTLAETNSAGVLEASQAPRLVREFGEPGRIIEFREQLSEEVEVPTGNGHETPGQARASAEDYQTEADASSQSEERGSKGRTGPLEAFAGPAEQTATELLSQLQRKIEAGGEVTGVRVSQSEGETTVLVSIATTDSGS